MKTAVKRVGNLSKESEAKTLEFGLYMLAFSFQAFAIIFNCLHHVIALVPLNRKRIMVLF